jgi:hypothetical protein
MSSVACCLGQVQESTLQWFGLALW